MAAPLPLSPHPGPPIGPEPMIPRPRAARRAA